MLLAAGAALGGSRAATAQGDESCQFAGDGFTVAVKTADIIVIGTVAPETDSSTVRLIPESYLKGPARTDTVALAVPASPGACQPARVMPGERVLVILGSPNPAGQWPEQKYVYHLKADGSAVSDAGGVFVAERNLTIVIRDLTGQYAVPAESKSEGAGIDLNATIIPVAGALLVVFVIGLVLMKLWHKIDPT